MLNYNYVTSPVPLGSQGSWATRPIAPGLQSLQALGLPQFRHAATPRAACSTLTTTRYPALICRAARGHNHALPQRLCVKPRPPAPTRLRVYVSVHVCVCVSVRVRVSVCVCVRVDVCVPRCA